MILSTLIFLFPSLYGEGYHSINLLLNGKTEADWNQILDNSLFYGHHEFLIGYLALVLFTKVFATSATNGGGGCGGTFAPSLFIGCFTGFLFSRLWNIHEVGVYVPEKNFALLGMAGVMSGVMHAPLTGIFLIAEITGGYDLFMPLMIVSVFAYLTIIIFEPHSIYGMRLARQGKLITHHTDHAVLTLMSLDSVIDRDYQGVDPDMELGQIVHKISRSRHNVLPNSEYYKVLPYIVELRNHGANKEENEVETCFNSLYGVMMLRLQKKEISLETQHAVKEISTFIGMLNDYYLKDKQEPLEFE